MASPIGKRKGTMLPNSRSNPSDNTAMRGMKYAKPACMVPEVVHNQTQYTTGPCQMAVANDPAREFDWFKKCTHGPEQDATGAEIPPHMRPYYEGNLIKRQKPVVGEGGVIERWETSEVWDVQVRVSEISRDKRVMSGEGPAYVAQRGAKSLEEFGIAPVCEFYRCWNQNTKKFRNGRFCSAKHAKLVKARETGTILALGGFDNAWPRAVSSEKRREQLAAIDV